MNCKRIVNLNSILIASCCLHSSIVSNSIVAQDQIPTKGSPYDHTGTRYTSPIWYTPQG